MGGDRHRRRQRVAAGGLGLASLDAARPKLRSTAGGVGRTGRPIGRRCLTTSPTESGLADASPTSRPGSHAADGRSGRPLGPARGLLTLGLWLAAIIYSVTYLHAAGLRRPVESLTFVLWFPDWVFWGIVVPWLVCTAISIYFALFVIEDDPLTSAADAASEELPPTIAPAPAPGGRRCLTGFARLFMPAAHVAVGRGRHRPTRWPGSRSTVGYGALVALLGVIAVSVWLGAGRSRSSAAARF